MLEFEAAPINSPPGPKTVVCTEMYGPPPDCKWISRVGVYSLQQCIRPVSIRSGHNGHPRVLVLINLAAFSSPLGTQVFQDAGRLLGHLVIVLSQTRWDPLRFMRPCARRVAQSPAI